MRAPFPLAAAAWLLPSALIAQDQNAQPSEQQPQPQQPQPQQAQPQQAQPATVPGEACPVQNQGRKKKSFAHDAGGAAAVAGGQVAGAAVAGPVGAAVGGVAVDHVGRAVKKVVKGGHDRRQAGQTGQTCAANPAPTGQ
jgi:DNA polymerase-3 subunit gamma/tau